MLHAHQFSAVNPTVAQLVEETKGQSCKKEDKGASTTTAFG